MSWVLVAGGAKKLGGEICKALARSGQNVVVHYRKSQKEAEETAKECQKFGVQAEIIQGDFSTMEETQNFLERYQSQFASTFGLVYNVGNYEQRDFQSTKEDQWVRLFQTNLHAPFFLTKGLLPTIEENKGRIVFLGVAGIKRVRTKTLAPAYMATKSALFSLMQSLAHELAPKNVTVNMVSPGHLEETVVEPVSLPLGRLGKWSEVACTIAFLLEEESCYTTGQNIEVAGGVGL